MTAHAKKLTKRATMADAGSAGEPTPASVAQVFVDALGRLGYATEHLLANAGIRKADLADPDGLISCAATGALFAGAMWQQPMKNLAVRLAAEIPIGAFPLIDYLVLTSDTVGSGLKQLRRYLRLAGAPYDLDPQENEDPIRVLVSNSAIAFCVEFAVTLTILHLRRESESELPVMCASFSHSPDDAREIEGILGCPANTNALWNGFALAREGWGIPMRRRDPVLQSVLEHHAKEIAARLTANDLPAVEVRRAVMSRMAQGDTQIQSVARALATSVRSLQRRLADAGLSYQQLLEVTRREAAAEYLSNPTLSVGEVAYLLGYSEPAAFHRAFKRWNGVTPQSFREQRNAGLPTHSVTS